MKLGPLEEQLLLLSTEPSFSSDSDVDVDNDVAMSQDNLNELA